ncbi:MAG: hypothetical protein E7441_10340 [Ruminococcaceae bacterium]|nr:hypothetical protein [Oscillospiraceae bacterium]
MKFDFNAEIMKTAYSQIGLAPINTAEHYQLASHLGFNSIKGDVRITKDNKLAMCHDAGITLDENGRIGKFDKDNCLPFLDLTYDYVMGLEYSAEYETMGHYAKVCDFETFVRICKEYGKIVYITLRDNKIKELVAETFRIVRKYNMENHCVINSFTLETLQEASKYTDEIPLSNVFEKGVVLTKEMVDGVIPFKHGIVNLFFCDHEKTKEFWEASIDAIEYARQNDVQVHVAILRKYSDYCWLTDRGVQGFQLARPCLPYTRTDIQFAVNVKDGKASFENILGSDRMTADITTSDGIVLVTNIRNNGSSYGYDDALPLLWLNKLPFDICVNCKENKNCRICFEDNSIKLDTNGKDGIYYVNVNI